MYFYLKLNLIVMIDMLLSLKQACTPHQLTLSKRKAAGGDSVTFYFSPKAPLNYRAGQYGIWMLPQFVKGKPARLFTIASGPESKYIELTTRISSSDFKQKLNRLAVGDKMYLFGAVGRFTLPRAPASRAVFIAGGIGITPFHAMFQSLQQQNIATVVSLIHVAHPGEYVYQDELQPFFAHSYYIERKDIDTTLATVQKAEPATTHYYVSGPPPFVKSIVDTLQGMGVTHIEIDGFLGYK